MFLEEKIHEKYFFHYLNLYHYNNLKLLHNSIVTDVPFLEIDETKMLSFNDKKTYTKGTLSNQLHEYVNRINNLIDYIDNRNKNFTSNSFYDKFFYFNSQLKQIEMYEYSKSITSKAYLGLYPFKINPEEFITGTETDQKTKITFLLTCEISTSGVVSIKAFNEKLLTEVLGTKNNPYTLRFQYNNIQNMSFIDMLNNLNSELQTYLSKKHNQYDKIHEKNLIKEIDKNLLMIENSKDYKKYYYQIDNKINFLFYENENIVNNNLHNYYQNEFLDKFKIVKKTHENAEDKQRHISYHNVLNNKNIINFYFKLLDDGFSSVEKKVLIKFKNKIIDINNFDELKEEFLDDYISIVYLINIILKKKKIDKKFNVFMVGNDEKLKNYAFNIEDNISYQKKLSHYINIDKRTEEIKKSGRTRKVILSEDTNYVQSISQLVDYVSSEELLKIVEFLDDDYCLFESDFKTFNLDLAIGLKEKLRELKQENYQKPETKSFFTFLFELLFGKSQKQNSKNNEIRFEGQSYNLEKVQTMKFGTEKVEFNSMVLDTKKNLFIDLNAFNSYDYTQIMETYIEICLNATINDTIKDICNYNDKKDIHILMPILYGKSNVLIDKIKDYGKIDTIIIDKPDLIPFYYLFPMLYQSNMVLTTHEDIKRKNSGYWAGFNPKILNSSSSFMKNKISIFLKYIGDYEKEKLFLDSIQDRINFKHFTNENYSLCSIKEMLDKIRK